ncbi:protein RRP5 homolog [Pogonomyrmex barbatus]|uniref:rRNA biogenesis protein RRP5 n=1 Tax=Pogonomyrmex barbatus TaxID=144034 RepID=A0A6I9VYV6_9HYME|nr:protein RRP5 homolog [Pogonomyrmex barbatus]
MTLQSFPRGGKKSEIKKTVDLLFEDKHKPHKPKKSKIQTKKKDENVIVEEINLIATTADRLSKMMLREGLVLLGRVSEISEYDLLVSIPGGFLGRIVAADLSQSYTSLLQEIIASKAIQSNEFKTLPDLYKSGDYVVCYVKSINSEEKWFCSLSMEPQLINQNVYSNYLVKDTKIICSIKSIEDHGYVIDTGMVNVKAFLATEDIDKGKQYFPGIQLLCSIKEIKTVDNVSIIKLSAKKKKIDNVSTHEITSLDILTPGTKLSLSVRKVLSNGLQVTFGKNNIGYINRIYLDKPLSMYTENMKMIGTLLYILPTVKLAYFSLLTDVSEKEKLRIGDIIDKAKVLYRESNGIILKLSKSGLRGYVSSRKTNVPFDKIPIKFKEGSTHKCRVLAYGWMEHFYICTMEEEILKQKYFSSLDVNIGDILPVTITHIEPNYIHVQAGKIWGTVSMEHISDDDQSKHKLKVGDNIEARVLDKDYDTYKNHVKFTLKQSLIKSKLPVLQDLSEAQCGSKYHGTISKVSKKGLLIRFYRSVKGWVPRNTLNWNTYFSYGQTVKVCVESVKQDEDRMKLRIIEEEEEQQSVSFTVGEIVEGIITESSIKGISLRIQKEDKVVTGFLPAGHLAPCIDIGKLLASKSAPGDLISAAVFAPKYMSTLILSRTFVTEEKYKNFESLKVGDCIPCTIRDIVQDGVKVILPIENYSKFGFVSYKNISNYEQLVENQILFVKVTAINVRGKLLSLTMSLKDVCDSPLDYKVKLMAAVDILSLYLNKLSELARNTFYENRPISSVTLGQKITGTVTKVTEHGLVLQLDNHLMSTVRKDHYIGNPKVGDKVSGVILWKDYVHELVDVSLLPRIINSISSKQKTLPDLPTDVMLKGQILIITKWLILVLVKRNGTGYLAALPVRRHANDISPDLTPYKIHNKIRLYVITKGAESDIVPICMLKSAFEIRKREVVTELSSIKNKSKKRKKVLEEDDMDLVASSKKISKKENEDKNEDIDEVENKVEVKVKEEENRIKDIDENSESLSHEESINKEEDEMEEEEEPVIEKSRIPECGFSWDDKANLTATANIETSSDDEEEPEEEPKRKKKKLSAAERREQERQKEREIRQREEALASNQMPNSIDQFDKLVLSSPDSSLIWLQYMAYHLQATEIDKARAVAKQAIKTINFREENERLNVWNAWLNLESRYGTAESLKDVFQEAVRTNDAYKVYLHMLTVHAEAGRTTELEKLVSTVIAKFKQNPQTWIDCGSALLKIGMKEKSRQIMQRALQSLPASQHVNLLVTFANLENKLGDKERAYTLFENVLSSYPKRVDVWSCYVDCLIKSENIDVARKVLEQASVLTLPLRKMKVLFSKYLAFEEKYGTPEAADRVRQMIADYVKRL